MAQLVAGKKHHPTIQKFGTFESIIFIFPFGRDMLGTKPLEKPAILDAFGKARDAIDLRVKARRLLGALE